MSRRVVNGDFSANDLHTILIRCVFSIMMSNRVQPALIRLTNEEKKKDAIMSLLTTTPLFFIAGEEQRPAVWAWFRYDPGIKCISPQIPKDSSQSLTATQNVTCACSKLNKSVVIWLKGSDSRWDFCAFGQTTMSQILLLPHTEESLIWLKIGLVSSG